MAAAYCCEQGKPIIFPMLQAYCDKCYKKLSDCGPLIE